MCRSTVRKLKVIIKSFSSAKNQIILLFCKTSIKIQKRGVIRIRKSKKDIQHNDQKIPKE